MRARWLIVLITAAALIATPLGIAARPVVIPALSPADLAGRISASAPVGWSGQVSSSGGLQVPDSEGFANLADVLGDSHDLRVWWRDAENWRIDSVRSTGETDLFFNGHVLVRWVFEEQRATIAPVSTVRLPDTSDLLPATLARLLLEGARPQDLVGLPARRIAGLTAAGLRLESRSESSRIARVDVWAEPGTGLPLAVEVSALGDRRPTLRTTVTGIDLLAPPISSTQFDPAPSVELVYEDAIDVAAAANAFAPVDLPSEVAGLTARGGQDPGAVGVYGQGPTSLIVIPLRRDVARPLRQQLRESAAARDTDLGTEVVSGPVALLLTPRGRSASLLLAGTVTAEIMRRAAAELVSR